MFIFVISIDIFGFITRRFCVWLFLITTCECDTYDISNMSLNIVFFKHASNKSTLPNKFPVTNVLPSGFQHNAVID